MWLRHTLKGNENRGGLSPATGLWSAQAVLAPSLYEAMLRSRCGVRRFAPGNVRNVGYAVRTLLARGLVVCPGPNVTGRGGCVLQATNRQ